MSELAYTLDVRRPEQRRILVTLLVPPGALAGAANLELFLPSWTPGSYMIREFARHLGELAAHDPVTQRQLTVRKVRKNRVAIGGIDPAHGARISYWVYAHELSVRTADLTHEHAYWNHACVLLWPAHSKGTPARIRVQRQAGWSVACALPLADDDGSEAVFVARDLDHAVDSPLLAGRFEQREWPVLGIPHSIALDGLAGVPVPDDLLRNLTKLVEAAAKVFDGKLPYDRYAFLCLFAESGHGGLEHATSTTLLSSRTALHRNRDYRDFLSLAVHELFHAWNIKRMRPAELWSYDLEVENYTSMLWLAEGFTAYYDDLLCRRTGVHSTSDYLGIVAKNLTNLWTGVGRERLSLADSSFDAWIRLYRPDENTRNSSQNYYGNGSVAALVLDLTIRSTSRGARSLDDVMRLLYEQTFAQGRGYERADVVRCLESAAGCEMGSLLSKLVDGPLDPEIGSLLAKFGLAVVQRDREKPYLGVSFDVDRTTISFVNENGPAFAAGLAPGDEVLALDNLRVTSASWGDVADAMLRTGRPARLLTSSRGVIIERTITPTRHPVGTVSIELVANATAESIALREGWLGASSDG